MNEYLAGEDQRLDELACDEISRVAPSLPAPLLARTITKLRESYDVDSDGFDGVEFFRLDAREAIEIAKREHRQLLRIGSEGLPRFVVRSRGSSRAPRRGRRVRTSASRARAPGRPGDDDPSPLAHSRPLAGVVA